MNGNDAGRRPSKPSFEGWMTLAVLVPVPAWFLLHVALDPGPAWRATYFAERAFTGASVSAQERQLSRYWDARVPVTPGGFDARKSSARYDTCLELEAPLEIPFMLVANGVARLLVDGVEELSGAGERLRWVRSKTLALSAGVHHLHVEFSARSWPSIGLLASLDGRAPVALGSGRLAHGASTRLPSADGPSVSCTRP